MGYFHDGHRSLMRRAGRECDTVAVSIFVNPLQFGEGEDFEAYPRDPERDAAGAEEGGVDLLFIPPVEEVYPEGYPPPETVDPGPLGERREGASRPGHFRGVLTVVARLLDLVGPCRAYFGEKDAQQLFLVARMVRERTTPVEVVPCETVRGGDGLALSSRNLYLSREERSAAPCLYRALQSAEALFAGGERRESAIAVEMARLIGVEPLAALEYAAVVNPETFEEAEEIGAEGLALLAVRLGRARLIDNLCLGRARAPSIA